MTTHDRWGDSHPAREAAELIIDRFYMKTQKAKDIIFARASAPAHPLDSFLSVVILRDHARLLKLSLRKLRPGEWLHRGDFIEVMGGLTPVDLSWLPWRRRADGRNYYRAM